MEEGYPVESVSGTPEFGFVLSYAVGTAPEVIVAGDAFFSTMDYSPGVVAAWEAQQRKDSAIAAFLNSTDRTDIIVRGLAVTLLNLSNTISGNVCPIVGAATGVWNPANMANGIGVTSPALAVVGAAIGDLVEVQPPFSPAGIIVMGFVSAADQVQVRLQNGTGAAVDPPSGTWGVRVRRVTTMPQYTTADLVAAVTANINVPPPLE